MNLSSCFYFFRKLQINFGNPFRDNRRMIRRHHNPNPLITDGLKEVNGSPAPGNQNAEASDFPQKESSLHIHNSQHDPLLDRMEPLFLADDVRLEHSSRVSYQLLACNKIMLSFIHAWILLCCRSPRLRAIHRLPRV